MFINTLNVPALIESLFETIGQSLSESKHTASHEDFPGKLIGSQNKASEAEGTTPMPRENKPRSPSKVESYDRNKAVIIRGLTESLLNKHRN